jgi:hypothetical protein
MDIFKTYYGPVLKAFAALDPMAASQFTLGLHGADSADRVWQHAPRVTC